MLAAFLSGATRIQGRSLGRWPAATISIESGLRERSKIFSRLGGAAWTILWPSSCYA